MFLDSFDPQTYRELLASESLDPDPLERLIATMQLGFATLASMIGTALSGERVEVLPSDFDPFRPNSKRAGERDAVLCGPNQMARLMSGMV